MRALILVSTSYLNLLVRSTFWRLQLKSVQTSAVVCADYTCSLHRLRRGFEFRKLKHNFMCAKFRMSKLNSWIYTHRDLNKAKYTKLLAEFSGSLYICIVLYLSLHTNYEYLEAIKGALKVLSSLGRVICAYCIDGANRYTSQYVNVLANLICPMCYGKKI